MLYNIGNVYYFVIIIIVTIIQYLYIDYNVIRIILLIITLLCAICFCVYIHEINKSQFFSRYKQVFFLTSSPDGTLNIMNLTITYIRI